MRQRAKLPAKEAPFLDATGPLDCVDRDYSEYSDHAAEGS